LISLSWSSVSHRRKLEEMLIRLLLNPPTFLNVKKRSQKPICLLEINLSKTPVIMEVKVDRKELVKREERMER
jgi:hypothetical protein